MNSTNKEQKKNKNSTTSHIDPNQLPKENIDFVQLQNNSLKHLQNLIAKSPISAQILMFLIEKMGTYNNSVICSYQTFMELTGYSRPTIARAIKHLKDNRWIETVKVGSATAYCVNAQVAWRRARNQKHYAIFSTNIIATSTENPNFQTDKQLRNIPHEFSKLIQTISDVDDMPIPEIQDLDEDPSWEDVNEMLGLNPK